MSKTLLSPSILLLLVGLPATGCGPHIPDNLDWAKLSAPRAYVIGGGDKLRVEVAGRTDMTREVVVRPDGMLTVPLIGDVPASGRLPDEIGRDIARRLEKYVKQPTVSVTVLDVQSYAVYVVGEVKKAGEFRSREPLTVLQALSLAGGYTPFAKRDRTVVIRKGANGSATLRIPFVYDTVVSGETPEQNIYLATGDTVVIP